MKRPIPYLPHTDEDRKEMLASIGIKSVDELLRNIPKELREFELNLPEGKSEIEIADKFKDLADKNTPLSEQISFCGGGVYNRFIPSVVSEILSKGEFYTAYTPYQPEVSQGTLQAIYEFQTLICNLTDMDAANASVYDGSTAMIEAGLMACRLTNRKKIILAKSINPEAIKVCKTYALGANIDLEQVDFVNGVTDLAKLKDMLDEKSACVIISYPNFAGCLEPVKEIAEAAHSCGALAIANVDLISMALLKSPGELNIDIAVGEGQQLGNPLNYGGPYAGFISCKKELVRQLPGRIAGLTKDVKGNRAFTLTLQTREQHIRREQATSNICTNQSLNALTVLIYLSYMGPWGLKKVAEISFKKAHELVFMITEAVKSCKLAFTAPFFNEFVLEMPIPAAKLISKLSKGNILPGLDLNGIDGYKNNHILVSVTEMNKTEHLKHFVEKLKNILEE